jgi:hypothetical protein
MFALQVNSGTKKVPCRASERDTQKGMATVIRYVEAHRPSEEGHDEGAGRKADYFRYGSKADAAIWRTNVRFISESGHRRSQMQGPLSANNRPCDPKSQSQMSEKVYFRRGHNARGWHGNPGSKRLTGVSLSMDCNDILGSARLLLLQLQELLKELLAGFMRWRCRGSRYGGVNSKAKIRSVYVR